MSVSRTWVSVCVVMAGLLAGTAGAVNIEIVSVGNPGNAQDTRYGRNYTGNPNDPLGYGSVSTTYNIGKYEVTNSQYAEFLNQIDPNGLNPYALYNTNMGSGYGGISFSSGANPGSKYAIRSSRGNMPVNYVSFWDACRFANWMNNGQGEGSTETGVYSLNGVTNPPNNTIARNPGAKVFIPSEDEWYKAAYYDPSKPGGGGYWDYPTQSNTAPKAEVPAGTDLINGSANYAGAVGDLTNVGSYTAKPSNSAYGTFDQGGNVWEWNEAVFDSLFRGLRGGSVPNGFGALRASNRYSGGYDPTNEYYSVGFRVAEVPEPATMVMLALASVGILRRKRA